MIFREKSSEMTRSKASRRALWAFVAGFLVIATSCAIKTEIEQHVYTDLVREVSDKSVASLRLICDMRGVPDVRLNVSTSHENGASSAYNLTDIAYIA